VNTDSTSGFYGAVKESRSYAAAVSVCIDGKLLLSGSSSTSKGGFVRICRWASTQEDIVGDNRVYGTPAAVNVTDGSFSVSLSNPCGTGYWLEHSPTSNGTFTKLFTVDPSANTETHTTFNEGCATILESTQPIVGDPYTLHGVQLWVCPDNVGVLVWNGSKGADVGSKLVAWARNAYVAIKKEAQNRVLSTSALSQSTQMLNGVISETINSNFNASNGAPEVSQKTNSDGSTVVTKATYAHSITGIAGDAYDWMQAGNLHMLAQVAQTTTYGFPAGGLSGRLCSPFAKDLLPNDIMSLSFTPGLTGGVEPGDVLFLNAQAVSLVKGVSEFRVRLSLKFSDGAIEYPDFSNGAGNMLVPYGFSDAHLQYVFQSTYTSGTHTPQQIREVSLQVVRATSVGVRLISYAGKSMIQANPVVASRAQGSSLVEWSLVNGIPRPTSPWVWKVNMDGTGMSPAVACSGFDFVNHSGTNWQYTSGTTMFGADGSAIEGWQRAGLSKTYSAAVIRNDLFLPSASIANAKFQESAALTCDYDITPADVNYVDQANGWIRGQYKEATQTQTGTPLVRLYGYDSDGVEKAHFGYQCMLVENAYGPTRGVKLEKGRDYVLSAWVKPMAGVSGLKVELTVGSIIGIDYRKPTNVNNPGWPFALQGGSLPCSGTLRVTGSGPWYLVELTVPASRDISSSNWDAGYQYGLFYVGAPNGAPKSGGGRESGAILVDDIRFYPKDALVTTTFYDPKWHTPLVSVDANGNPSQRVVRDGYGRPIELRKINRENPSLTTLTKAKLYHLAGE
jgi:hypothetical protein